MFEQCGILGFSLYQKEEFENAKEVIRIRSCLIKNGDI
jgi:hypothetical protein